MNKPLIFSGIVLIPIVFISIPLFIQTPPPAAAGERSHAEHGHHETAGHGPEDRSEQEDHAPHAHSGHAPRKDVDSHAGHDHEAHGHDGHDDHGDQCEPGEICPEHGIPEAEDALCHSDRVGELQPGQGMMVRLASPEVSAKAGFQLTSPRAIAFAEGIAVPGKAVFNRNRLAQITPLAGGVVREVHVLPGASVKEGEILARVAIPEIASLKARLFTARAKLAQTEAAYRREKDLLERGITSHQEFQLAESDNLAARSEAELYRQQLLNFGLSSADIQRLLKTGDSGAVLPLRAPFSGTVVEVRTAVGEAAEPGSPLFLLANLDTLWVELSIPESRIYLAREGIELKARFDGQPAKTFPGRVFQVGAAVEERTRTLQALAEVGNPDHDLKAGMFGTAYLQEGNEERTLAVPADALQNIDGNPFVFVHREPGLYELRRVQTGTLRESMVPILAGLADDDRVISSQGFALKSEILKARLGASCADH